MFSPLKKGDASEKITFDNLVDLVERPLTYVDLKPPLNFLLSGVRSRRKRAVPLERFKRSMQGTTLTGTGHQHVSSAFNAGHHNHSGPHVSLPSPVIRKGTHQEKHQNQQQRVGFSSSSGVQSHDWLQTLNQQQEKIADLMKNVTQPADPNSPSSKKTGGGGVIQRPSLAATSNNWHATALSRWLTIAEKIEEGAAASGRTQ